MRLRCCVANSPLTRWTAATSLAMTTAILCVVFFAVVATTSSQSTTGTYDFKLQQFCSDNCQQQEERLEILENKYTVLKNEIAQLKEHVDNLLQAFSGTTRPAVSETTTTRTPTTPGGLPTLASCPVNFTYVASVRGCYQVVLDTLSWSEANQRCISLHQYAHQLVINNAAEQTVVSNMLFQQPGNVGSAWTAGQRMDLSDGTSPFIWRVTTANTYTELPLSFTSWHPAQPDGWNNVQFCIIMERNDGYQWDDKACNNRLISVCEIDLA